MARSHLLPLLTLSILAAGSSVFADLGSEFTYQGELMDDGEPVEGTIDLRFSLYQQAEGGNPLTEPLTFTNVQLQEGLITQTLDFGDVFRGRPLWLEVAVDRDGGADDFIVVGNRIEKMPAPYAHHAVTAGGLTGPHGHEASLGADGTFSAMAFRGDGSQLVNLPDDDPTNELQSLQFDGSTLSLQPGNSSVNLSTATPAPALYPADRGTQQVVGYLTMEQITFGPGMDANTLASAGRFHQPALPSNCIVVLEAHFNVSRTIDTPVGTAQNRETSDPTISTLTIRKPTDKTTPLLFNQALLGTAGLRGDLTLVRTDQSGNITPYLVMQMQEILLASQEFHMDGTETITLDFQRVTVRHTSSGNAITYDLRTNSTTPGR